MVCELLTLKFVHPENFAPNKEFYKAVKITAKRWWDIYYGRKPCTQEEYVSLATYFKVTMQEAWESRQLSIFSSAEE
jgi:hypothetical protein